MAEASTWRISTEERCDVQPRPRQWRHQLPQLHNREFAASAVLHAGTHGAPPLLRRTGRAHRPGAERKRPLPVCNLHVRIAGDVQTQYEHRQPDRDGVHSRRARIPRAGRSSRLPLGWRRQRPERRPGNGGKPERSPALRCGGRGFVARRFQATSRKREKLSYLGCMTANARFGPQGNGACSKVLRTGSRRGYGSGLYKVSQLLRAPTVVGSRARRGR